MTTSNLRCFISYLILSGTAGYSQSCVEAPKGLSAWFQFEGPGKLSAPGKVGKGLRFDGKEDFWEVPLASKGLDFGSGDFSIEFWLKTSEAGPPKSLIDKRNSVPVGYLVYVQDGRVGLQVGKASDRSEVRSLLRIDDNRWHHVAAVAKRLPTQPARIFVDGKPSSSLSRNLTIEDVDSKVPVWFGRHHRNYHVDTDDIFFRGELDEISFYRRELSGPEIASIFRAGVAGKCRQNK